MKMSNQINRYSKFGNRSKRANALRLAVFAVSAALIRPADAGTSADGQGYLVTLSFSGATALRAFTTNPGSTYLESGLPNLVLSNGTYLSGIGQLAPATYAPSGTNSILAQGPQSAPNQGEGLRIEYHEQGAIEGILELADAQIQTNIFSGTRDPNVNNPLWINQTKFNALGNANGYTLAAYNATQPTYTPGIAPSTSYQGQNKIQAAITNQNAIVGFSYAGASNVFAAPASPGYGKGNPNLPADGIGAANGANQLQDQSLLNNPSLGLTGGVNNLTSTFFAQGASIIGVNPGTGLVRINKTDAQWLETSGRLQNGADFTLITGDPNNGTRNVVANDTGVDPSWAVGENDNGNGNLGTDQNSIGANIKYSGKTSVGTQLRPTVQNLRSGVGILGYGDARSGNSVVNTNTALPLRALDYADSYTDPTGDPLNPVLDSSNHYLATPGQWARVSLKNIVTGAYAIGQFEAYVTVNDPSRPGHILGDPGDDVLNYINFVQNSADHVPLGSILGPGDTLLQTGFVPLKGTLVTKSVDGAPYTYNGSGAHPADETLIYGGAGHDPNNPDVNSLLGDPTIPSFFSVVDPTQQTKGNASAIYSGASLAPVIASFNSTIKITDPDSTHLKGNWLLGNFNQNGTRDFSSLKTGLYALQDLLASGAGNSIFTADGGSSNSTGITYSVGAHPQLAALAGQTAQTTGSIGANKGDLIVLGDFNGDGKFDGKDLFALAHGSALSDASGPGFVNGQLTTASGADFGDQVRHGILRKNAALDFLQANTAAGDAIRVSASQNTTNDPTGINAFNKFDVNHDGLETRSDAAIVDKFIGKNYTNLNDQLAATINQNGSAITDVAHAKPFNLVDAKLLDTATGQYTTPDAAGISQDNGAAISRADFDLIRADLGAKLVDGDVNFDGTVNFADLLTVAQDFGQPVVSWSKGNIDGLNGVNFGDLLTVAQHFGQNAALQPEIATAAVPEPGTLIVGLVSGVMMLRRRRRS